MITDVQSVSSKDFLNIIKELNDSEQILFLVGFQMSQGIHLGGYIQDSLKQIPLYILFNETLDYFSPMIKYSVEQPFTNNGILLYQIHTSSVDLSKTFFIDSCQVVFESLTKDNKQQICGHSLLSYLLLWQPDFTTMVQTENDTLYDQENENFQYRFDHTDPFMISKQKDRIEAVARQFKYFNSNFLESRTLYQKLDLVKILNVPISYALYYTPVTCITQFISRQYKDTNWMFTFKQSNEDNFIDLNDNEKGKNGGIFEVIYPEHKYASLKYVMEGDFESEYPSIIIAYNISPETLVTDQSLHDKCNKYIINYRSGMNIQDERYVYFLKRSEQVGIFPQLCTNLLAKRRQCDKQSATYKSLKLILAEIYGFIGMKLSPFYKAECMKTVCSIARKTCDEAMKTLRMSSVLSKECVVARYTDSCQFLLPSEGKKMTSQFAKIIKEWPAIQCRIQEEMNAPELNFKLEKTVSLVKIYLAQICSSISIIGTLNETGFKGFSFKKISIPKLLDTTNSYQYRLQVKGLIQWDKFHIAIRNIFKTMLAEICIQSAINDQESVVNIAQQQINYQVEQIQEDIVFLRKPIVFEGNYQKAMIKKQYEKKLNLLAKYAKFLKFSNKEGTCRYLQQVYNIKSQCQIIPYIPADLNSRKKISECYIPFKNLVQLSTFTTAQLEQRRKYKNSLLESQDETRFRLQIQQFDRNIQSVDFERFKSILDPIRRLFGIQTNLFSIQNTSSNTLISAIQLQPHQCQVRIEQPGNGYKKCSFQILNICDLQSIVMKNQNYSFHEILVNKLNKMYFDIETEECEITEEQVRIQVLRFVRILNPYMNNPQLFIASAKKVIYSATESSHIERIKYSFHCIVNVACTKNVNKFVANQINKYLKEAVDQKVYASKSLRLPSTIKIDKHGIIERRPFIFTENYSFNDFILTDVSNCTYVFDENIMFDNVPPITIMKTSGNIQQPLIDYVLAQIKELTNKQSWYIRKNNKGGVVTFCCNNPYKCPVCQRTHDSDGLYGSGNDQTMHLNCYSNSSRYNNAMPKRLFKLPSDQPENEQQDIIEIEGDQVANELSKRQIMYSSLQKLVDSIQADRYDDPLVNKQDNTYVKYDLIKPTTYVISGMGSGKSTQLIQLLQTNQYKTIICLSFRITFTSEFAKKYDLVSYKDIVGTIKLSENPKVIIQVDSLFRLDTASMPDLLIVDEVESILEKIDSSNNTWSVISTFIDLINKSQNIIVMDGLMERMTIKYLNILRKTDNFAVFHNTNTIRSDYTLDLYQYHSTQFQFVIDMFVDNLSKGKKIYGMITQKTLGEYICTELTIKTGKKCIFYHGDNLKQEQDGLQNHKDLKDEHFKDVNNNWVNYDVVLHSSTVTAGVSFDVKDYFDMQINVLNVNTCSAISFIQGCHRVRHLKDKFIVSFIEPINKQGTHIPIEFTNAQYSFHEENSNPNIAIDIHEQVQCWLLLRKCMSLNRIQDLVIKYSKSMGYHINARVIPEAFVGSKFSNSKDLSKYLYDMQIPLDFGEIMKLPLQQQQIASQKFEIARLYNLFNMINSLEQPQLKYLIKNKYVQTYRQTTILNSKLLPYDPKTHSHRFWDFNNDWLANIKYINSEMKFGIEMYTSQSILKLKELLIQTNSNFIKPEDFEKMCIDLHIERNVLNTIEDLMIPVRSKKGIKFSKLAKTIIAFMQVLCYDVELSIDWVKFVNFSIPSKLNIQLPEDHFNRASI